jgi:hypothetical protein
MAPTAVQPDISYYPEFTKYQARTNWRLQTEDIDKTLPDGFPARLESPLVWEGRDFEGVEEGKEDWIYRLGDEQLDEIDAALKHFICLLSLFSIPSYLSSSFSTLTKRLRLKVHNADCLNCFPLLALKKPLGCIKPSTFPLPTLRPVLRSLSYDIHFGRGFTVLRGLRIDDYTREENIIIYVGVSSHIGPDRGRQDDKLDGKPADVVLTHIIDLTNTYLQDIVGGPENIADGQVYHTDAGNIVGLIALGEAAAGGESQLASSWRIYNELAKTRPDLVRTLAEDWVVDG